LDLQHDIEVKTEEALKEATQAGKQLFMFIAKCEADILKGTFNLATFIPKHILDGLADKSAKVYRGKQPIKKLVGSGAKLENIPLNKENTKEFDSVARKYGVDYSLKKAEHGGKTQYLVFFKAKDINVLTAAFRDFSARVTEKEHKKSIKARVKATRTAQRTQKRELKREKKRDRGVDI